MGNETIIGAQLREARLNKKISLDELQQKTKIQKRYLEALELGDFDRLPGDYYVRTFIRQYAQAVGLDGNRLVAAFDGDEDQILPELPKREVPEEIATTRTAVHEETFSRKRKQRDLVPIIILGSIAFVIIIIVAYTTLQDYRSTSMIDHSKIVVESSSSEVKHSSKASETKSSSSSTASTSSSTSTSSTTVENQMEMNITQVSALETQVAVNQAKAPIDLQFTGVNGPCWIGVLVSGSYVYQYTLQAGQNQSYTLPEGTTQATIVLGASDNVNIQMNKKDLAFKNPAYPVTKKNIQLTISYQGT